jgi:PAS domain-containing protein
VRDIVFRASVVGQVLMVTLIDVTGHKETERSLQAATKRMRLAAVASGIGFWTRDLDTEIEEWDDQMLGTYGVREEFDGRWEPFLHPDDRERAREEAQRAIDEGRYGEYVFRIIRPDGTIRHLKGMSQAAIPSAGRPSIWASISTSRGRLRPKRRSPRPATRSGGTRSRIDASWRRSSRRATLIDRDGPSYFQGLEHLLRSSARPPFALERLSVSRGADGQIARIRYMLPRHKVANWVGPSRSRKSTRPGANGVVDLSPFEFLDRLADLVPPPRKHRHRYHGVFAPNHKLRRAVTSLAIGNVGKRQEAVTGGHGGDGHATEGCCDAHQKLRSHDTSRIAWAKLMARVGEEFPLECPACGGDIRLRGDGRQEPAHFEPEVRKREKARMASPA